MDIFAAILKLIDWFINQEIVYKLLVTNNLFVFILLFAQAQVIKIINTNITK